MLDGKELARRLVAAMDEGPNPITSSALARLCKVKPQAVHGWRATGKIARRHFQTIARATKKPLGYFLEDGSAAREPEGQYTLEASALLDDYNALPDGLKEHLARKASELRRYVEALPPFLRDGLKPPEEWDAYKQFERELEADMAKRGGVQPAAEPERVKRKSH